MTYELYYSPDHARLHTATKTAELAERLAVLERAIGSTQMQSGVRERYGFFVDVIHYTLQNWRMRTSHSLY